MTKYNTIKVEFECCNCKKHVVRNKSDIRKGTKNLCCNRECHNEFRRKQRYKEMCDRVGCDFKDWLTSQYWDKERPTRDISIELYNTDKNSPNVLGWMKKLNIPVRNRSDAVALQWKENHERRKQAGIDAVKNMGAGTPGREKLILYMETNEYKQKISDANSGENNWMFGRFGDKSPMWNPNLTDEDRLDTRKYKEYSEWRRLVFERDKYTCQVCRHTKGGNLTAHHLNGYHWDKAGRTDVNNGVTLCESCHKKFHRIYGYGDNDFFQFAQFQTSETLTKK